MPANKKYLTASPWQRFAKVTAALLGGLLITVGLFSALSFWLPDHKTVVITSVFGLFPVWIVLMIIPFLVDNGLKVWIYYLAAIGLLATAIYFGKTLHPIS